MEKGDPIIRKAEFGIDRDKPSLIRGQIVSLYKNKALGVWSNILLGIILLTSFWFHFPQKRIALLLWLGFVTVLSVIRFFLSRSFVPTRRYSQQELVSWANHYVFLTSLLSTIWGLAGIVFFPSDWPHLVLLILILFSVFLLSIPTLAASRMAYYFQIIVILAPTTILLFLSNENGYKQLGAAVVVLAGTLIIVSGYIYHLLFELQSAQVAMQSLSETDKLTGIANRRQFDRKFKVEWRRAMRERTAISLLLIDVDNFRSYNEIYGDTAGDECLQQLAKALDVVTQRPADIAARYGGEEFAVLLPVTTRENAVMLAERIRKRVEFLNIEHSGSPFEKVTVSVGVSCCQPVWDFTGNTPDDEQTITFPAMLLTAADNALYVAQEEGGNCFSEQGCGDQKITGLMQKKAQEQSTQQQEVDTETNTDKPSVNISE